MSEKRYVKGEDIKTVRCDSDEQETVIQFSRYDDPIAHIFTSDNTIITKLKKLVIAHPDSYKCYNTDPEDSEPTGYFFDFPKKAISFKQPTKKKELTEEQIEKVRQRLRKKS